jgi:hypothetical protein
VKRLLLCFTIMFAVSKGQAVKPVAAPPLPSAEAQAARAEQVVRATEKIVNSLQGRMDDNDKPPCFSCADEAPPPKSCGDAYSEFYSKPVLDFRISLGYADMPEDPLVAAEDGPRRAVWIEKLLRPCPEGVVGTCGFNRADIDDGDSFTKMVAGPDGKEHLVNLHLVNSSVGIYDNINRTKLKAQQDKRTKQAESNFFDHLCSSDLPVYAGHARNGAGASFGPPILHADNVNTNEKAYDHTNEERMLDALRKCPHPPKLIGLFACQSGRWFSTDVLNAVKDPKTGLPMSGVASSVGLTEPEVVFAQAYAFVDSVLALRCAPEFKHALNEKKDFFGVDGDGKGATLTGFFKDSQPSVSRFRTDVPLKSVPLIHPVDRTPAQRAKKPPAQSGRVN